MSAFQLLTSGFLIVSGQSYFLDAALNELGTSNIRSFDLSQGIAFDGTGNPPNRGPGGERGPCEDSLITLVPGTGSLSSDGETCDGSSTAIDAFTIQEQAKLWLYVSGDYPSDTTITIQLIEDRILIETKDFVLPATAGIISIQLDHNLDVDTTYRWTAEVNLFSGRGRSANPTGGGIIERQVYPEALLREIGNLSAADRARYFLTYGLWYDALNEIATARLSNSEDEVLVEEWENLLTVFGLNIIGSQPLIDCCQNQD